MLTTFITIAIIPGLCPIDDIILWLMFPSIGIWLIRKFKWCKKSCKCHCHGKKEDTTTDPVLDAMRQRIHDRIQSANNDKRPQS